MAELAEFRRKPVIVHAVRFDGGGPAAEAISRLIGPALVWPEFYNDRERGGDFTGNLIVQARDHTELATPGTWIVRDEYGDLSVSLDVMFRDAYEPWTEAAKAIFAAEAS